MRRSPLLALLFAVAASPTALNQDVPHDIAPRPPRVEPPRVGPLVLESHTLEGRIEAAHARLRIVERFSNPAPHPIEGVYLRPIPKGATARGLALIVDGKRMNGEILDAGAAAKVYREIVARMKDPALLEHVGEGLLRASIFPVPARGHVDVEIDLDAPIEDLGCGILEFAWPLRNVDGAGAKLRIDLELATEHRIDTIYSPTHPAVVERSGHDRANIRYQGVTDGRDFRLYFAADEEPGGLRILTHRAGDGDGYFLVIHEPEATVDTQSRDIVFVIDRSGSMAGEKWAQAVRAIRFGIDSLRDGDRFALISFATDVRVHPGGLTVVDDASRKAAKAHLDSLTPTGGTNIGEALAAAMPLFDSSPGRFPLVAFVTDGLPTVGETDVRRIVEATIQSNAHSARVFAFGVGFDVNTILLDNLAADSRADSTYVAPGQDLELPLSAFFAKATRPVLSGPELSIHGTGIETWALEPQRPNDLFAGDLLRIAGRYRGTGTATITLSGTRNGTRRTIERSIDLPAADHRNSFLPGFWAARRIGQLLLEVRLHGPAKELVDEVTRLGTEYGIVTPYTSGLVVEDEATVRDRPGSAPRRETADSRPKDARGALGGLAAPEPAASGEKAVEYARELKKLADGDALAREARSKAEITVKTVGSRTFDRKDGVWVDRAFSESLRQAMVEIVAFSSEYFALLDEHPDLSDALALGTDLIVVVNGKAIRISPKD